MKKTLALFLAVLMLLSLVACGGGGNTPDPAAEKRTDVNLVMATVLGSNDVQQNSQINGQLLMWNVYEPLFYVTDAGTLEPRLAESYEVAADNVTYTVHLRKGVKFHNGEEFTADDVVYSFARAATFPTYASACSVVASCTKIDDYTVQLVSTDVMARFMATTSDIKIVNKTDGEKFGEDAGQDLEHTMAGTGPYYFTEFNPETSIQLTAFEDYYGGAPEIKTVNYKVMTDASTILAALEAHEVDFASITTANVSVVEADEGLKVMLNPSTHDSYIKFDWMENEVLADKRVRQAICYALDKEEIMYGCYDGYGDIAENFAREGLVFGATTDGVNTYPHDPEKAKELLAEAGYPDGVDIGTLWAVSTLYFAQGAQIMQQQLAKVGITVKCELLEQKTVEGAIFRGEADWDMAFHGGAMSVDSDRFFDWQFNPVSGTYCGKGSGGQVFDINPELVRLGMAAKTELDAAKREQLYHEFWKLAQEEAYVIAIFHRYNAYGMDENLNAKLQTNYYYINEWSWN